MSDGQRSKGGGEGGRWNGQQWRKGYKEQHDLVMMQRPDQAHDGDKQQEDAHGNHPSDDVDAGHQTKAFPPCCYTNQQQADQLRSTGRRLTAVM